MPESGARATAVAKDSNLPRLYSNWATDRDHSQSTLPRIANGVMFAHYRHCFQTGSQAKPLKLTLTAQQAVAASEKQKISKLASAFPETSCPSTVRLPAVPRLNRGCGSQYCKDSCCVSRFPVLQVPNPPSFRRRLVRLEPELATVGNQARSQSFRTEFPEELVHELHATTLRLPA